VEPRPAAPVGIFAVDDHPTFLATLERVIKVSTGFQLVGTARSGPEALRVLLGEPSTRPDLLLVDVVMKPMSGLEFVKRFRAAGGDTATALMSSYDVEQLLGMRPTPSTPSTPASPHPLSSVLASPSVLFVAKTDLDPDNLVRIWEQLAGRSSGPAPR
jgi:CheY-like chemotaxis protein